MRLGRTMSVSRVPILLHLAVVHCTQIWFALAASLFLTPKRSQWTQRLHNLYNLFSASSCFYTVLSSLFFFFFFARSCRCSLCPITLAVLFLPMYPLPISVTSSPFLISQTMHFFPLPLSVRCLSSLLHPRSLLLCTNLELHEIMHHRGFRRALSFRVETLSGFSTWKVIKMPDITLVRAEMYS